MKKIALLFFGFLSIVFLIALWVFGTVNDPLFRLPISEYRPEFNSDGTGVYLRNLIGEDGEIVATLVVHQIRQNYTPGIPGAADLGARTVSPMSIPTMSSSTQGDKIHDSKFFVDERRVFLTNGPWLLYFSDQKPFRKIHVEKDEIQSLENDTRKLTPKDFLRKWVR